MKIILVETTIIFQAHVLQACSLLLRQQLPWHNVTVMLHLSEQYSITGTNVGSSPGICDQIDRLCGPTQENNLARGASVDETRNPRPRILMSSRSLLAYRINPPVNVRVILLIEPIHSLNHLPRLLRGGRIVKIDYG